MRWICHLRLCIGFSAKWFLYWCLFLGLNFDWITVFIQFFSDFGLFFGWFWKLKKFWRRIMISWRFSDHFIKSSAIRSHFQIILQSLKSFLVVFFFFKFPCSFFCFTCFQGTYNVVTLHCNSVVIPKCYSFIKLFWKQFFIKKCVCAVHK